MLYKFMEVYNDVIIQQENGNEYNEYNAVNECFICFEIQKEQEIPIQLKHQTIFLKICQCDGCIHDSCLKVWFNINEKCPICRTIMFKNDFLEFEYGFYIYYYFYIIKKFVNKFIKKIIENIVRFRNFYILCAIISNIMNIVSNCCNKYDNYNYIYTYDYCLPSESHYSEPL